MLEWRPRLIALIFVVVLIGLVAGIAGIAGIAVHDGSPLNWEW